MSISETKMLNHLRHLIPLNTEKGEPAEDVT